MRVRQLKNALYILGLLEQKPRMRFSELLAESGVSRPSLAAMLELLCKEDYLRKTDAGYSLGFRFLTASSHILGRIDVRESAAPHLEKLSQKIHERVELSIPDGLSILFLHIIESRDPMGLHVRQGTRLRNLHSPAPGKILLAHLKEADQREFFGGDGFYAAGPEAKTNARAVRKEFDEILKSKTATDINEARTNVARFASEVLDAQGQLTAMVSITVASFSLTARRKKELLSAVKGCGQAVSEELGYRGAY